MFAYTISNTAASLFIDGRLHTIQKDDSKVWERLLTAIKERDIPTIQKIVSRKNAVKAFLYGTNLHIRDNTVYNGDKPLHNSLTRRILKMMDEGFDIKPMLLFLNNLLQNPSARAVEELYTFLEVNNLPITEDGRFLAYKRVRYDYMDVYSGTVDNHVGQIVKMPRNQVNDDCRETCSFGLHVASLGYLAHYSGERLMAALVNPKDVVSIPIDYDNSKMRVCEYEVHSELNLNTIAEYDAALPAVFKTEPHPIENVDDYENDDEQVDDDPDYRFGSTD
jgi:hypothetical protein